MKLQMQEQVLTIKRLEKEQANTAKVLQLQDKRISDLEGLAQQQYEELQRTEHIVAAQNNQELKDLEEKAKGNALDWNESQMSRSLHKDSYVRIFVTNDDSVDDK